MSHMEYLSDQTNTEKIIAATEWHNKTSAMTPLVGQQQGHAACKKLGVALLVC